MSTTTITKAMLERKADFISSSTTLLGKLMWLSRLEIFPERGNGCPWETLGLHLDMLQEGHICSGSDVLRVFLDDFAAFLEDVKNELTDLASDESPNSGFCREALRLCSETLEMLCEIRNAGTAKEAVASST